MLINMINAVCCVYSKSGLEVIKPFSCSTQLGKIFQVIKKAKMLRKIKSFLSLSLLDVVCVMLTRLKRQQLMAF